MLLKEYWIYSIKEGIDMKLQRLTLTLILNVLSLFRPFMKFQKNRITFISLTSDRLESDFREINKVLVADGSYDLHYNLVKYKKTVKGNFLYLLNCIKQLYEVNVSRLIILNDNNFVVTKYKGKHTKVMQTWHACGAIKKLGNEIKREYQVKNYDYVLSCSDYWKPVYAKSFGVEESQVYTTGLARADKLVKRKVVERYKEKFFTKYPNLKDKYIIVYAPTFRGDLMQGLHYENLDIIKVLKQLDENCVIVYKMHPLLKDEICEQHERVINANNNSLYELLCVCDCLISDYSSIIFDYSLLQKKLICYVPDYQEYEMDRGYNVDYFKDMPGPICVNEQELVTALNQKQDIDFKKIKGFQEKFMPYADGKNVQRIKALIDEVMQNQ